VSILENGELVAVTVLTKGGLVVGGGGALRNRVPDAAVIVAVLLKLDDAALAGLADICGVEVALLERARNRGVRVQQRKKVAAGYGVVAAALGDRQAVVLALLGHAGDTAKLQVRNAGRATPVQVDADARVELTDGVALACLVNGGFVAVAELHDVSLQRVGVRSHIIGLRLSSCCHDGKRAGGHQKHFIHGSLPVLRTEVQDLSCANSPTGSSSRPVNVALGFTKTAYFGLVRM
jgi:hypothetical protein